MPDSREDLSLLGKVGSRFRKNKILIIGLAALSAIVLLGIDYRIGFSQAQWWHLAGFVTLALIPVMSAIFVSETPWGDYSKPPAKIIEALLALGVGLAITFGWRGGVEAYPIAFPAGSFFLLVIFALIKYMQHESESKAQNKLNSLIGEVNVRQKELTNLLNTMPPAQAMTNFKNSYLRAKIFYRSTILRERPDNIPDLEKREESLREGIRMCMNALARLYVQYEHKPLTDACFAHWVRFYSIEDLESAPELLSRAQKRNPYTDFPDDPLRDLEGVLHVDPDMAIKVSRDGDDAATRDENVEEIFLPFPTNKGGFEGTRESRCIPIAPRAFEIGVLSYPDVRTSITRQSAKDWSVNQQVVTKVIDYFHNQQNIGSALGYRLSYQISDTQRMPLGVVIIFTRNSHSKDGDAVTRAYLDICSPFLEMQTDFAFDMVMVQDKLRKARKKLAASEDEEAG